MKKYNYIKVDKENLKQYYNNQLIGEGFLMFDDSIKRSCINTDNYTLEQWNWALEQGADIVFAVEELQQGFLPIKELVITNIEFDEDHEYIGYDHDEQYAYIDFIVDDNQYCMSIGIEDYYGSRCWKDPKNYSFRLQQNKWEDVTLSDDIIQQLQKQLETIPEFCNWLQNFDIKDTYEVSEDDDEKY